MTQPKQIKTTGKVGNPTEGVEPKKLHANLETVGGQPASKTAAKKLPSKERTVTKPTATTPKEMPLPAKAAKVKRRHWRLVFSFLILVCLPAGATGWYLWERAADQFASTVGFSVRTEEPTSPLEVLGGIGALSGSSSSDTDILYEFIQSQELVARVDAQLDLRTMWSKPENDPYFRYSPPGTIEDLVKHWGRMVKVHHDSGSGLIEIRALAFDPDDATRIAEVIYDESSEMINALNDAAREDALRYARLDLENAVERLKVARTSVTEFRNRTQIVDPEVDMQTQAGLLGNLQAQQAEAVIELDLLMATSRPGDTRVDQARLRVEVIEERIQQERRKLGIGNSAADGDVFADLFGEYERLAVDRQFAEQSYVSALATFDAAVSDARRQSRYLAAHVLPTTAEKSQYPKRLQLTFMISLFLLLCWAILVLVTYSLRDRR